MIYRPESSRAKEVVGLMAAPGLPGVFVLGSPASRVTLYDQQKRALNLLWALSSLDQEIPAKRFAVVGAGIAGLTAAAAAGSRGSEVDLFEAERHVMTLQRGDKVRYIHPNLYDWPRKGSSNYRTELPFLNWKAGTSASVVKQLEASWQILLRQHKNINCYFSTLISGITRREGRYALEHHPSRIGDRLYDYVILALGFGLEVSRRPFSPLSYWAMSSHGQTIRSAQKVKSFLISGCGDGGLVDTLTLRLEDFDHAKLVSSILHRDSIECLRERLVEIDIRAEQEFTGRPAEAAWFIWNQYEQLFLPPQLLEAVGSRLRSDTAVVLNDRLPKPFSLRTSLLNRFALFLLAKCDPSFEYIQGTIVDGRRLSSGFKVQLSTSGSTQWKVFDEVIIRHGTQPGDLLTPLVGEDTVKKILGKPWPRKNDPSTEQHWVGAGLPIGAVESRRILKIGILLNGSAAYAQAIMLGFIRRSSALLVDTEFSIRFDSRQGRPEKDSDEINRELVEKMKENLGGSLDYLFTIGSGVSSFAVRNYLNSIPIIFAGISFPVESGIVKDLKSGRKNGLVSGVYFSDDYSDTIILISRLFPGKRLGFLYNPDILVDVQMWEHLKMRYSDAAKTLRREGIEPVDMVPLAVQAPVIPSGDPADLYFGWYFLHTYLEEFIAQTKGRVPFIGAGITDVRRGAVAASELDEIESGELAAEEILWRHLRTGGPLHSVPLVVPRKGTIAVNLELARKFKLDLNRVTAIFGEMRLYLLRRS